MRQFGWIFPPVLWWRMLLAATTGLAPAFCFGALTWDALQIELTSKPGDQQAVGVFHFVNSGSAPVTITSVQPSCGCTTAELAKPTYAPGEAGEIKAIFTLGDRMGLQEKTIAVTTDDASANPVPLVLRVTIPERFTYLPRMLVWRTGEEPVEKPVIISPVSPQKIISVAVNTVLPAGVTARIEPLEAKTKFRLLVRPASSAKIMNVGISCVVLFADGTTQPFTVFALVK